MKRREFLKLVPPTMALAGCSYLRIDPMHVLIRSDRITSLEQEQEILSRARLKWTEDGTFRVLYLKGDPYEIGYQHGALLRREVQDNLLTMYKRSLGVFHSEEFFAEAYERARPFIPQDYIDEMHGLAHGAKLPLDVVHYIHVLPSITEWGGKKRLKGIVEQMMAGELGTSCSNIGMSASATRDNKLLAVRILDWGLHKISKLHEYPLITVVRPNKGVPYANIGWVGFLGCISGMNAEKITIGEMGDGDTPNETLAGDPMPFVMRQVLASAKNLGDVRKIIQQAPPTCSFAFLMTDGKANESELYLTDPGRFSAFKAGTAGEDHGEKIPAISGVSYGGHDNTLMSKLLAQYRGQLTPELLMKTIIPQIAMKSNFQNVVYSPTDLTFWVSNAKSKAEPAFGQPYTFFDFGKALAEY